MSDEKQSSSPNVSIPAEEYIGYKTEKLQKEMEESLRSRFRKSLLLSVGFIAFLISVSGTYIVGEIKSRVSYIEYATERARRSDNVIEESLVKLDRATKESEVAREEIQLLKKQVIALSLQLETLQAKLESSKHAHRIEGDRTSASGL